MVSIEIAQRIRALPRGLCYSGAYLMLENCPIRASDRVKLCHGIVTQTDGSKTRRGHAWVEISRPSGRVDVYDYGNPIVAIPAEIYYRAGKIEPGTVKRYSWFDAKRLCRQTRHQGPWDETITAAAHSGG
jgi:hypothetical protein